MALANRVIFLLLSLMAGGCEVASEATVLARIAPPDARPVQDGGVSDAGPNVPPARLQLLDRGFVAKEWMEKPTTDLLTATELRNLKNVRSRAFGLVWPGANAMSSALLFQESAPDVLNPEALANYDEILDEVLGQGLGVVVHPVDSDERTWTDPNYSSKLVAFWRALGRHLSTRNPETLFIKVGYDPTSSDPDAWYAVQKLLLSAVRESNPTRTLLVTPNAYTRLGDRDPVKALVEMTPLGDTNVVYDFGFFTPITFTLQGAYWREPWLQQLHDLPYPSSPEACAPVLANIADAAALQYAQAYCSSRYGRATQSILLDAVSAWAKTNQVQIVSAGIGVYKPNVDNKAESIGSPTRGRCSRANRSRGHFSTTWATSPDSPGPPGNGPSTPR